MTNWRTADVEVRDEYVEWIARIATKRTVRDHQKYGDTYDGNPLETVAGELFDALYAVFQLSRNPVIMAELGPCVHPDSMDMFDEH